VPGFFKKKGKNTHSDPLHGNYLKIGIYKWDWSNGTSDTDSRVMFHDELRITDARGTYEAVAPGHTTVPHVIGLTQAGAVPNIRAAALLPKFSEYGRGRRYVHRQTPAPSTRVRCGTTVFMEVSRDEVEDLADRADSE
jgi:hypothetical protein